MIFVFFSLEPTRAQRGTSKGNGLRIRHKKFAIAMNSARGKEKQERHLDLFRSLWKLKLGSGDPAKVYGDSRTWPDG